LLDGLQIGETMNVFKKIIEFLKIMKDIDIWGDRNEDLSDDDIEYLNSLPKQNPYGMVGVIIAGLAFLFPEYGFSAITLIYCIVTFLLLIRKRRIIPGPLSWA
jgi:hypothetical protein